MGADVSKTVDIIFNGTDKVSDTIKTVSGKLDSFSTSVTTVTQPLASLTKGILAVDAALVALAGAGLVKAFQASSEFATASAGLKKVMGDNAEAMLTAQNTATSLSEKYGVSASNVLSSTTNFVQAGFNIDESMKLAANSLDLVIAGDMEAAEASKLLVATLKGFDAPASEATRLIDGLNEVSNNYATDVRELATGMSTLAPIASQMGMSFEETMGVLTPVIEVFQSGDEAATALKTGLLKLIDDSAPVKEALAKLGVSQADLNGHLRSGKDILKDVAVAFQTADEKDKLFLTSQLVGIEQSAKMVTVFDNLAKTTKITETALNSAGSAAKEVAAMLETPEAAVKRLKESFTNLNREIGDKFKEAATAAINGGTSIEQALRDMVKDGTFDPIFDKIKSFASKLSSELEMIAQNLPEAFEGVDFSELTDAFDDLGDALKEAFEAFFGEIDLTTVDGLSSALQKIIDTGTTLTKVTEGIVEGLTPFIAGLGKVVDKSTDVNSSTAEMTGKILGFATGLNTVVENMGLFTAGLGIIAGSSVINAIANIAGLATKAELASAAFAVLTGGVTSLGLLLGGGIAGAIGYVTGSFLNQIPAVQNTAQAFFQLIDRYVNFTGTQGLMKDELDGTNVKFEAAKKKAAELAASMTTLTTSVKEVPESKSITFTAAEIDTIKAKFAAFNESLKEIPDTKSVEVVSDPNVESITETKDFILMKFKDGTVSIVQTNVDDKSLAAAKKTIEEVVPAEKRMEIKANVDIAKIKAQAEIIQAAVEWKAKLDIAEVEANAEIVKTAFESITAGIESTGSVISDLLSLWANADTFDQWDIQKQIDLENDRRTQEFELQKQLTEAQLEYYKKRNEMMNGENDQALITISGEGMEPALEMVMWEIIKKVQIRANESSADFLLGLDT